MFNTYNTLKTWRQFFLVVVDTLAVFVGAWVVYLIRYNWFDDNFLGVKQLLIGQYMMVSLVVALSVVFVYSILGVYSVLQKKTWYEMAFRLTLGILIVILVVITFFFFNEYNTSALPDGVPISRFILGTGGFVALYFVFLGRVIVWLVGKLLNQFGIWQKEVAVVANGDFNWLIKKMEKDPEVSQLHIFESLNESSFKELKDLIISNKLSRIYLSSTNNEFESELAITAERYNVGFVFATDGLSNFQAFALRPLHLDNKVFLELVHSNLDGWNIVLKRILDFIFAAGFILIFSWLYILIAILIKIDSKGSVFYLSDRVGPDGRSFKLWKFRRLKQEFCTSEKDPETIKIENELIEQMNMRKDGVLYKIADDPRSTRIGRFIEKYSLDELPQFFNVLIGNLSVVGPRPHQPREVAKYAEHHYKVLNIKPGITGLAQVNGRSDLAFEQEVGYDTYYIEHWSLFLDFWIIIKTPWVILFERHR